MCGCGLGPLLLEMGITYLKIMIKGAYCFFFNLAYQAKFTIPSHASTSIWTTHAACTELHALSLNFHTNVSVAKCTRMGKILEHKSVMLTHLQNYRMAVFIGLAA